MSTSSSFAIAAVMLLSIIAGCTENTTTESVSPHFQYELYAIATTAGPGTKTILDLDTQTSVLVQAPPLFTHADIAALEVTKHDHGQSCIVVVPTAAGLARLRATAGKSIGFVLNGGLQRQVRFRPDESGRFTLSGDPAGLFFDSALPRVLDRR